MGNIRKICNCVAGLLAIDLFCVVAIIVAAAIIVFSLLWVLPIVAAVLWAWWWIFAELLIVWLYIKVWKVRQLKELTIGDNENE